MYPIISHDEPAPRSRIGGAAAMTLLFGLMAGVSTANAQISWVPALSAAVEEAVPAGNGAALLCRAQSGNTTFLGTALNGVCSGVVNNSFIQVAPYELAIGLANWDSTPPPNQTAFVGGTQGVVSLFACRVRDGGVWVAGQRRSDQTTCTYLDGKNAPSLANGFETLYSFNLSNTYRLETSGGMCVLGSILNVVLPPQQYGCNASNGLNFQLQNAGANTYNLRNPAVSQCLSSFGASATRMGPCGAPEAALQFHYANAGDVLKIRFANTAKFLEVPNGSNSPYTPLYQITTMLNAGQYFRLRTLEDSARRLNVMTYNLMLLDGAYFPGLKQDERARWIADAVNATDPGLDVIAAQELLDGSARDIFRDTLAYYGYTYTSKVPDDAVRVNGGVRIFSRWPIELTESVAFNDCQIGSADCLAAKGVSYARINKLGRRYHVFTTHLQADEHGNNYFDARKKQIQQMNLWAINRGTAQNEPIIYTGDLNVDMESTPSQYAEMLQTAGATFFNAPRLPGVWNGPVRWTVNKATNEIKNFRDPNGSNSWLDYILVSNIRPAPIAASYIVKEYENRTAFPIIVAWGGFGSTRYVRDLSDHSALLGSLIFAYGPAAPAPSATVPVTIEASSNTGIPANAGVVVNGQRFPLPVTLDLASNQTHTITADDFVPVNSSERFAFQNWFEQSTQTQLTRTLVNPDKPQTLRAYYGRQFLLTTQLNPILGGTVSGAGWYDSGTDAVVTASAANGFTFTGFTGAVPRSTPSVSIAMNGPRTQIANFVSNGLPVLHAETGARSDKAPGVRQVDFFLRNAGSFPAVNARITGIDSIKVLSGSGVVKPLTQLPVVFNTVLPGNTVNRSIDFEWPATALRIAVTVSFAADGGYSGLTTIYIVR